MPGAQAAARQPHPVAASRGGDRELGCAHYDDCLDVAVRSGWAGFACGECPVRGTAPAASDQARREQLAWGRVGEGEEPVGIGPKGAPTPAERRAAKEEAARVRAARAEQRKADRARIRTENEQLKAELAERAGAVERGELAPEPLLAVPKPPKLPVYVDPPAPRRLPPAHGPRARAQALDEVAARVARETAAAEDEASRILKIDLERLVAEERPPIPAAPSPHPPPPRPPRRRSPAMADPATLEQLVAEVEDLEEQRTALEKELDAKKALLAKALAEREATLERARALLVAPAPEASPASRAKRRAPPKVLTGAAAHQRDTAGEVLKFMKDGGPRRVQELVDGLDLTRPAADSAVKRLVADR